MGEWGGVVDLVLRPTEVVLEEGVHLSDGLSKKGFWEVHAIVLIQMSFDLRNNLRIRR